MFGWELALSVNVSKKIFCKIYFSFAEETVRIPGLFDLCWFSSIFQQFFFCQKNELNYAPVHVHIFVVIQKGVIFSWNIKY